MWEIKSDGVYSTLQWALSACSSGTCGYKSVTVHSWGSGERRQQWTPSVHFPNIYRGCYTRFNILGKFHLVLPPLPFLTSILSATEMPDCPPYRPLNELSVPHDTAVLVCCFCLHERSRSWTMGKIGVISMALLHLPSEKCRTLNNPVVLGTDIRCECPSGLNIFTFPVSLLDYTDKYMLYL